MVKRTASDGKAACGEADHVAAEDLRKSFTIMMSVTHADDEEIVSFQGFRSPWWKRLIYYLIGILTVGFSFLLCKWSPRLHILLSLSPCALRDAEYVRIRLADGRVDLEAVQLIDLPEPLYDSHPADEQPELDEHQSGRGSGNAAARGGLLDWRVRRVHRLLEYRCTRYFYVEEEELEKEEERLQVGGGAGGAAGATQGSAAAAAGGSRTRGAGRGGTFVPVPGVPRGFAAQLHSAAVALAATGQAVAVEQQQEWDLGERELRYGSNEMAIPVKTLPMLIFDEMWHPFYVFQYFSILVWVVGDQYYSYAVCIAVITWFSIVSAAVEAHRNMRRLADIAHFECDVDVIRGGEVVRLPSRRLVPGDLVVVGPGTLPCDLVLMRGECILDENMLTGESVPVRKVPYNPVADGLSYDPDKCPGCTLFGGTVVAQARAPRHQKAVAMVCRTRFYSAKGQLLRSILFPREHEESFISDSLRFIVVMLVACLGLYVWAAVVLLRLGASPGRIVVRFFDMITVAVPPALPACLTIATVFSIGRLRKRGIYVTSPDRITLAGQLDVIAFDKTGTLTEQGLDLQGIVPVVGGRLHDMVTSGQLGLLPVGLVELLASCHGLARMGESLVGDPLDQKLFQATQWDLIDERPDMDGQHGGAYGTSSSAGGGAGGTAALLLVSADGGAAAAADGVDGALAPGVDDSAAAAEAAAEATGTSDAVHTYVRPPGAVHAFAIIKRFEFSAALQRNLVVVRAPDASVAVFAKGSPEALRALVDPASVPPDFDRLLGELTREGLRVLALAAGDASGVPEAQLLGWTQAQTEAGVGLRLVGLAVMANPLRPDTADVISRLQYASIRTVMVTGDHLRTAVSVAHKCNILPPQRPILLLDAADSSGGGGSGGGGSGSAPSAASQQQQRQQEGAGMTQQEQQVPPMPQPSPAALAVATPGVSGTFGAAVLLPTFTRAMPVPVQPSCHDALASPRHPHQQPYMMAHPYGGVATGPGPAGEPTPLGDPSIQGNGAWGAAMLVEAVQEEEEEQQQQQERKWALAAAAAAEDVPPPPPVAVVVEVAPEAVKGAAAAEGPNGAFLLLPSGVGGGGGHEEGAAPAAPHAALRLSILDADGNVLDPAAFLSTSTSSFGLLPPSSAATDSAAAPAPTSPPVASLATPAAGTAGASSAPTPSSLLSAVMTGDLECAVTGKGFSWLLASLEPGLLLPVLQRAAVFARMSPDNKRDLMLLLGAGIDGVEGCPHLGLRAGFCGDGANDCGALKAAHVGVSLCEAEASVAAPMTSKAQTIASMITVVAEGRCTLMATYQIFQFIIAYALVQAFETNLMYTYALNMGNYQYLIEDLFFTTVLAALMGFTEPRTKLSRSRPHSRVMSLPLLVSTVAQCLVTVVAFQLASIKLLERQPGYSRFQGGPELHDTVAPENTVTYLVALGQFVVLALVFNKGMPHRSPLWTNGWLVAALVVQSAFVIYSLFSTDRFNREVQQLVDREGFGGVVDTGFRWKLLGLLVAMGASAYLTEYTALGVVKLVGWVRGGGGGRGGGGSANKGTKGGNSLGSIPATVVGAPRMDRLADQRRRG